MSQPLGIGVVGAGRFAAFCVAAFDGLPEARVVAGMDVDRARAEVVAPPAAATYVDLEALLRDPAVDIVHIATPPYLHGPIAKRAAERGEHVFVEKPLAKTLGAAPQDVAVGVADRRDELPAADVVDVLLGST